MGSGVEEHYVKIERGPGVYQGRGPGVDQGKHLWLRYLGKAVERGHFFPSKRRARKKYKKCGL